jgi:hypothetical protein
MRHEVLSAANAVTARTEVRVIVMVSVERVMRRTASVLSVARPWTRVRSLTARLQSVYRIVNRRARASVASLNLKFTCIFNPLKRLMGSNGALPCAGKQRGARGKVTKVTSIKNP